MKDYKQLSLTLKKLANKDQAQNVKRFFKTQNDDYAYHDKFIGVTVPLLRKLSEEYSLLNLSEIRLLVNSPINEERLLGLFVLIKQYNSQPLEQNNIFDFYIENLKFINNWNLVDSSAHKIIGAHLLHANKQVLITLAKSSILWERRIAIVSTWWFIKHNQYEWTLKIAELLINDSHDLIHKAVGWMLREVGKKSLDILKNFLDIYSNSMPRTMLRYSIEKLSNEERNTYLRYNKSKKENKSKIYSP